MVGFCLELLGSEYCFFNDPAPTEIYTLSLHDALPISAALVRLGRRHRLDHQPGVPGPWLRHPFGEWKAATELVDSYFQSSSPVVHQPLPGAGCPRLKLSLKRPPPPPLPLPLSPGLLVQRCRPVRNSTYLSHTCDRRSPDRKSTRLNSSHIPLSR